LRDHTDIEGPIICEKIAVLARNRYIFLPMETLLKEEDLPFWYHLEHGAHDERPGI